jgi:hypothetical protein
MMREFDVVVSAVSPGSEFEVEFSAKPHLRQAIDLERLNVKDMKLTARDTKLQVLVTSLTNLSLVPFNSVCFPIQIFLPLPSGSFMHESSELNFKLWHDMKLSFPPTVELSENISVRPTPAGIEKKASGGYLFHWLDFFSSLKTTGPHRQRQGMFTKPNEKKPFQESEAKRTKTRSPRNNWKPKRNSSSSTICYAFRFREKFFCLVMEKREAPDTQSRWWRWKEDEEVFQLWQKTKVEFEGGDFNSDDELNEFALAAPHFSSAHRPQTQSGAKQNCFGNYFATFRVLLYARSAFGLTEKGMAEARASGGREQKKM